PAPHRILPCPLLPPGLCLLLRQLLCHHLLQRRHHRLRGVPHGRRRAHLLRRPPRGVQAHPPHRRLGPLRRLRRHAPAHDLRALRPPRPDCCRPPRRRLVHHDLPRRAGPGHRGQGPLRG